MSRIWIAAAVIALGLTLGATSVDAGHRLGAGVNYWVMLDDIANVDRDGFSYLLTWQYRGDLLGMGTDVEMLPDRFGEDAYAGQVYFILGKSIYGAAGAGVTYSDGDFSNSPFFSLRAGMEFEVVPSLFLDINANYRFDDDGDLNRDEEDIGFDTIFLGAAVRVEF